MSDSPVHFTLRRAQAHFSNPRTWLALGTIGVLLGLVGPFGTFGMIPVVPRLIYWLAICAGSYAVGYITAATLTAWLHPNSRWLHLLLTGLLPGLPIALFVLLANGLTFGFNQTGVIDLLSLLVYCPLIALGIAVAGDVLGPSAKRPVAEPASPAPPALLARLPHAQRGCLLHLAVADHYVEVTTDKGRSLVLMRLSDAIKEAHPIAGLQVHRSHWVALDAVTGSSRQAGKPVLHLQTGAMVPVSRTYLTAARAAGLLA